MPSKLDVEAECVLCSSKFLTCEKWIKRGWGKFCSRFCQRSYQALINAKNNKCGISLADRVKAYKQSHKNEILAHKMVESAIKKGSLKRGCCEICGHKKTDGHHDDYSKPLDVRWLCRKHHLEHHKRLTI